MENKEKLTFVGKVYSILDETIKFIFLSQGQIIEFSYINKGDGKDIVCVPCQTSCNLKCKFCFLSDYDLAVRNLSPEEIEGGVSYVIKELNLIGGPATRNRGRSRERILLISFMGCGEPLLNLKNVIEVCELVTAKYKEHYRIVRYGLSSLIPSLLLMDKLTDEVFSKKILMKFHLSLHSPSESKRKVLLPAASSILESINAVQKYMEKTGNSSEIHYSLVDGENDTEEDLAEIIKLLKGKSIPIKFLIYNKKPSLVFVASPRVLFFRKKLERAGIKTEFYIPPGGDIGSSCGQFLMDYYEKYNKKK